LNTRNAYIPGRREYLFSSYPLASTLHTRRHPYPFARHQHRPLHATTPPHAANSASRHTPPRLQGSNSAGCRTPPCRHQRRREIQERGPRGDQRRRRGRSSRGAPPPAMEAAPRGAHPSAMGPARAELAGRRGLQLRRRPRHRCAGAFACYYAELQGQIGKFRAGVRRSRGKLRARLVGRLCPNQRLFRCNVALFAYLHHC
jgi:hypothetical protein